MSALRLAVVGNPENRRVTLFAGAAAALGLPAPRIVPWLDAVRGTARFEPGEIVRIDSPGENAEVATLLRGSADPVDMYRVEGTAAWYAGFTAALNVLHEQIRAAGARPLADPAETAIVFDKAQTHAWLGKHGVAVPPALPGVQDYDSLVAALAAPWSGDVFVKIRHGSSASGVVALVVRRGRPVEAITSAEIERDAPGGPVRLYNSLQVRRYRREADIRTLVDTLAADGLHAEAWVDKHRDSQGRHCDVRVVTVAGRATHAVVRTSGQPMTNLHLGGRRGDLAEFQAEIGRDRWAAVLGLAEQAAACFPGTHCLGVDILPTVSAGEFVGEVNAYGDLLPNLPGLPGTPGDGVDTCTAQLRTLIEACG
ncbi:MAG TPA: STM4014 family protein [Actinocrinis sp.]|nr:STM4014 family protein [Actinocrinis sp.]